MVKDWPDYQKGVRWLAQEIGVFPQRDWASIVGNEKIWPVGLELAAGEEETSLLYTVPGKKLLLISDFAATAEVQGRWVLYLWGVGALAVFYLPAMGSQVHPFSTLIPIEAGKKIYVIATNMSAATGRFFSTTFAYEVEV